MWGTLAAEGQRTLSAPIPHAPHAQTQRRDALTVLSLLGTWAIYPRDGQRSSRRQDISIIARCKFERRLLA